MYKLTVESKIEFDTIYNNMMAHTVNDFSIIKFMVSTHNNLANKFIDVDEMKHGTANGVFNQMNDVIMGITNGNTDILYIDFVNELNEVRRPVLKVLKLEVEQFNTIHIDSYDTYCNLCDKVKQYSKETLNKIRLKYFFGGILDGNLFDLISTEEGINQQINGYKNFNEHVVYLDVNHDLQTGVTWSIKTLDITLDRNVY